MVINEEVKILLFSMKSMAQMYAKTDEDFGRFCRGFYGGAMAVLGAIQLYDILPTKCPDDDSTSYASFCAVYGTYLNAERKPRLDKNHKDYKMMYGKQAQAMMREAEGHLENFKKQKKAGGNGGKGG